MKMLPVVYVTKWALTRGILVFRNVPHDDRDERNGNVSVYVNKPWRTLIKAGDWTTDAKTAHEQANVKLTEAIRLASKRFDRLSDMKIKVKEQP